LENTGADERNPQPLAPRKTFRRTREHPAQPDVVRLDGKAIAVTGAAAGLGRAYAIGLADAGAVLVLNDVDAVGLDAATKEISAAGGRVAVHAGSVADWDEAGKIVAACVESFGAIDGWLTTRPSSTGLAPTKKPTIPSVTSSKSTPSAACS
jgi:short chain dehydrogenase